MLDRLVPTGWVRLSGAADAQAQARAARPGGLVWAELAFSISLEFLIAFLFPSLGFHFKFKLIQTCATIQRIFKLSMLQHCMTHNVLAKINN
jgi:hypothetical protein